MSNILKIAVICNNFNQSNINKLPWKYIYKISSYLSLEHNVFIISDSNEKFDEIRTINVRKVFYLFKGETKEVLNVLEKEKPDKIIMLLGLTSFLRREFRIEQPVIGVFTSPIYKLKELINNIGLLNLFKYRKYTLIHVINSIIPSYFVRRQIGSFEKIVFLSNYTRNKLVEKGFSKKKSFIIPLGIEEQFLDPPDVNDVKEIRRKINPEEVPIIMYFTSPLTLRGTDTLIKAFSYLRKEKKCKLIFLSRIDYSDLKNEEKYLKKLSRDFKVSNSIEIISNYLKPNEIKSYISVADIVCIPFKLVISDVPISILEAMALKKPVISTNVASLSELLPNGITVDANDPRTLAETMLKLLNNDRLIWEIGAKNKDYMDQYPNWVQIASKFDKIIQE